MVKAASEFVPDYDPDMYEYMMLLAIRESNISSLVPTNLGGTLQDKVYENNKISKARINARIRELEILLNPRRAMLTS